jgi:hypothetical protein
LLLIKATTGRRTSHPLERRHRIHLVPHPTGHSGNTVST